MRFFSLPLLRSNSKIHQALDMVKSLTLETNLPYISFPSQLRFPPFDLFPLNLALRQRPAHPGQTNVCLGRCIPRDHGALGILELFPLKAEEFR